MATRAQKVRLGVFMLLAFLLMVGTVGTLAGLSLWNPKHIYYVNYEESVSGLEVGSAVKMKGVRVGRVERVKVAKDAQTVRVELALDPGTPVKQDTQAIVTSIGITGLKFIELTGGTPDSPPVEPNGKKSRIKAGASMMQTLTGKATDIAKKTEQALNNILWLTDKDNRAQVSHMLVNANRLLSAWADIAESNKERIGKILTNVDRTTKSLNKASRSVKKVIDRAGPDINATLGAASRAAHSISRMAAKLKPEDTLAEISSTARALKKRIEDPAITKAMQGLKSAGTMISTLSRDMRAVVRGRDRQLGRILVLLTDAAANLKSFARSIKERPSLLLRGETRKERKIR